MWRSSNSELRTCISDKTRHMKINRLQQFLMQCIISSFSPFENVPLNNLLCGINMKIVRKLLQICLPGAGCIKGV
jgi:hypothetical protein